MKLLLTNDDGIDAPGLQALVDAARGLGDPIVVAPAVCHSGCGHRVTTGQPIRVEKRSPAHYVVHGTPADCVRVGLHRLAPEAACILAGINAGGNLGADVYHSGTVAAAREAVLHGRNAVALSYYRKGEWPFHWLWASQCAFPLLRDLLNRAWEQGSFWNVNLPHLELNSSIPEAVFCALDPMPLPLSYREDGEHFHYNGIYHARERKKGCDVDVCFSGKIAVTKIALF
jgi:5'-nucleotidase